MKRIGTWPHLLGAILLLCIPSYADLVWTGDPALTDVSLGLFSSPPILLSLSGGNDGMGSSYFADSESGIPSSVQQISYTVTRTFEVTAPGEFALSSYDSASLQDAYPFDPMGSCFGWGIFFSGSTTIAGGGTTSISQQLSGSDFMLGNGASDSCASSGLRGYPGPLSDQKSDMVYLDAGSYDLQQVITAGADAADLHAFSDSTSSTLVAAVPESNGYGFAVGIATAVMLIRKRCPVRRKA